MARGLDHAQSDADLVYTLPGNAEPLGIELFTLEFHLSELLGRKVEMLNLSAAKPWWRKILDEDRVAIYDDAA
jgi:predicted nucleotidyltransferase